MKKTTFLAISLSLISSLIPSFAQDDGGSIARSTTFGPRQDRLSEVSSEKLAALDPALQAQKFIEMARKYMAEGQYPQAKEALRTAIRIDPMNPEAWALYDEALIAEYIKQREQEKLEPDITESPLFSITRVDSYMELDTLFVVGSLKNISDKLKQKIKVTAVILDQDKKELRRQSGDLNLANRGLLPNESSLFEIPFKNPPKEARSYQVEVAGFED